ncbi:hypothetical protein ACFWR9_08750 [Streptomyces sp. NPDC058534]|uniref:hypothetical protein n=1 Tax=Streptomyces sp. NPDC058534 TaxID=3346541 RepID=UPI00364B54AD
MQDYPRYQVHSEIGEAGFDVELRIDVAPGGGLPGMATPDEVARVLVDAMAAAGATRSTAMLLTVQATPVPAPVPAQGA